MLSNDMKNKIKTFMSVQQYLSTGQIADEKAWDKLFESYGDGVKYIMDGEGFLVYDENEKEIFIRDFIAFGNGDSMIRQLKKKNKDICGMIHISNIQLLNVMHKFAFKIENLIGKQYLVRSSHG